MKKYVGVAAFWFVVAVVCLCISWTGEIIRASNLPTYKIAGATILMIAAAIYTIISLYLLFGRRK